MSKIKYLLIVFVLSACAQGQKKLTANLDLVLPYTRNLENNKVFRDPYVAAFKKGNKKLFFVAADHISTKNGDPLAHPTMKTIQKLFVEYDIDAVVVEGIQPWQGPELPMGLRKSVNECAKKNFKGGCGESFYSLYLGLEKTKSGSPVILTSGEPKEKTIALKLEEAGFSRQDLVGFYLVRIIPQWRRRGTLRKPKLRSKLKTNSRNIEKELD